MLTTLHILCCSCLEAVYKIFPKIIIVIAYAWQLAYSYRFPLQLPLEFLGYLPQIQTKFQEL
jgi:hypothetical protein